MSVCVNVCVCGAVYKTMHFLFILCVCGCVCQAVTQLGTIKVAEE